MARISRTGTREQILSTALDLFLADGFEATSLRQIAEHLGITKAALWYHFPAKEQLVVELTRPFLNGIADLVADARASGSEDITERRVRLLGAYLDLLVVHERVVRLLSQNPAAQNHPDVGRRVRTLIEAYTAELTGPDGGSDERIRVACATGAISAAASLSAPLLPQARAIILGAALSALHAAPFQEAGHTEPKTARRKRPAAPRRANRPVQAGDGEKADRPAG